jgi:radical SAM superfamily enzyme YgiQ (UPF0313 family)
MEKAVRSGLRSLFIGFETLDQRNLCDQSKYHNLKNSYHDAIQRLHGMGVMVNASFMFGLDRDNTSVFSRTVEFYAIWHIPAGGRNLRVYGARSFN